MRIENYFNPEINQRRLCSKKLSKCISAFDYIEKIFIILSATAGVVCTISHATVVGASVGIASAGFTLVFSLSTGIIKKIIKNNKKQQQQQQKNIIKNLCWLKVNSIALKL